MKREEETKMLGVRKQSKEKKATIREMEEWEKKKHVKKEERRR